MPISYLIIQYKGKIKYLWLKSRKQSNKKTNTTKNS